jgi:hypothetical protein
MPTTELSQVVTEIARPLLEALGDAPPAAQIQSTIKLVVDFWNAQILFNWGHPRRKKPYNELKKAMYGRAASAADRITFETLHRGARRHFADPRLVAEWHYVADSSGAFRLYCVAELPDGVEPMKSPRSLSRSRSRFVHVDRLT